jgi:hypothetical protein
MGIIMPIRVRMCRDADTRGKRLRGARGCRRRSLSECRCACEGVEGPVVAAQVRCGRMYFSANVDFHARIGWDWVG